MKIDINKHYFHEYAGKSELQKLNGFSVGEIVVDRLGWTGCILVICEDGAVRMDSNGMDHISNIKKVRSKKKIADYLERLHSNDILIAGNVHQSEMLRL